MPIEAIRNKVKVTVNVKILKINIRQTKNSEIIKQQDLMAVQLDKYTLIADKPSKAIPNENK